MKHPDFSRLPLLVVAGLLACGGDGGSGGSGPDDPVLTSIEVTPSTASVYNTAPGNTVNLLVIAKDQNGVTMTGLSLSFTSGSTGIATVSATGTVTAVATGTAQITVSVNQGSVTVSKQVPVTVVIPPLVVTVGSSPIPQPSFVPRDVHLSAGGDVTWSLSGPEHSVTFISIGSPPDVPSLIDASASRNFPNTGTFNYKCDFHPTMFGTVFVH